MCAHFGAGLPGAGGGELRAEVVARVSSAVRFDVLADFQYVSHDGRPLSELVSALHPL